MTSPASPGEQSRSRILQRKQPPATHAESKLVLSRVGSRACSSVENLVWQNTMAEVGRIAGPNAAGPVGPVYGTNAGPAAPEQKPPPELCKAAPDEAPKAVPKGSACYILHSPPQLMHRISSSPDLRVLSPSGDPARLPSVARAALQQLAKTTSTGREGSGPTGTVRPQRASVELLVRRRTISELLHVRSSPNGRAGPHASEVAEGPAHTQRRISFSGAPKYPSSPGCGMRAVAGSRPGGLVDGEVAYSGKVAPPHVLQEFSGRCPRDGTLPEMREAAEPHPLKSGSPSHSHNRAASVGQRVRRETLGMLRREGKPNVFDAGTPCHSPAGSPAGLATPVPRTPQRGSLGSPRWSDYSSSGSPRLSLGLSSGPASHMIHRAVG